MNLSAHDQSGPPEQPEVAVSDTAHPAPPQRRFTLSYIFFGSDGLRAGWGILLFYVLRLLLLFYCAFPFFKVIFPWISGAASFSRPSRMLAYEGMGVIAVALATWLMAKIERRPTSVFGLGGTHRLRNFLSGLAWGVAMLSLLVFTLRACGLLVFDARQLFGASALRFGAVWLSGFLLVGLFEETFFRGYLQFTLARGINGMYDWLRSFAAHATECSASGCNQTAPRASGLRTTTQSALGFWTAALLLSFYFGLGHRSNAGESPIGLVAAALIAVVFCLSLWRTGSLWWAIGFHAAWDWAQSFLYGVADSGLIIRGHLFSTHPVGRPIFSGGLTGPEGSLFILPIVGLTAAIIVLTLPRVHHEGPPASANTRTTAGLDLP
jgi:membrane protease YdiL (CAAX protease family)